MSLDPELVAEVREWLCKAQSDLESSTVLIDSSHHDTAVFHVQQAAEKAWKAFLVWHDIPFRRTHDLRELGAACARLDTSLAAAAIEAEELTQFAWAFRYPGSPQLPTRQEAGDALGVARKTYQAVLDRLPDATHP